MQYTNSGCVRNNLKSHQYSLGNSLAAVIVVFLKKGKSIIEKDFIYFTTGSTNEDLHLAKNIKVTDLIYIVNSFTYTYIN